MYFSAETLATNSRLRTHWNELWANRNMWDAQHRAMMAVNRNLMTPEMLAANALAGDGLGREFWAEIDRQVIQLRDQEIGMEIVSDLMGVQTDLSYCRLARLPSCITLLVTSPMMCRLVWTVSHLFLLTTPNTAATVTRSPFTPRAMV